MSDCNWTNHFNSWLIQERNAVMLLRDLKQCCGCVWNDFYCRKGAKTANMASKTNILNLNRVNITFVIMQIFGGKKLHSLCDINYILRFLCLALSTCLTKLSSLKCVDSVANQCVLPLTVFYFRYAFIYTVWNAVLLDARNSRTNILSWLSNWLKN